MMTAISAWWTFPNTKKQRTGKRLFIQVFLHLLHLSTIVQNFLFPQPPTTRAISSTSLEDDDTDFEVDTQCSYKDSRFLNQNELDDVTRDLVLTKAKAEILFSHLKEWNLLASSWKISKPRKRHIHYNSTFCSDEGRS